MKQYDIIKEENKYLNIGKYKGTSIIIGLCIIQFVIDVYLRCRTGEITFIDLLLGRNAGIGSYEYVWFKKSYLLNGQIWRIISWMFWSRGILQFLAEATVLCLLCKTLEKWIGTLKLLLTYILLGLIYLFASFLTLAALNNNLLINFGMGANTLCMVFAMAGVVLTLAFTGGNKPIMHFNINKYTSVITLVFLIVVYIYYIYMRIDRFYILYAFSFGVLAGLIFSWRNQNIFIFKTGRKKAELLPKTKIKPSQYIGTLIIISLSLIVFLINVAMINKEVLISLYGTATPGTWLQCFWRNLEGFNDLSKWLVMNTEKVNEGQFWRFFTNVFSHYGFEHILTNMPVIYFTGKYLEPKIGTFKLLAVFLTSSFAVSMSWYLAGGDMTTTGGSSLGLYAFIALFFLYAFEYGNQIHCHSYEIIYIFAYFILGNIPGIGVWGEGHMTSFAVGYVAIFIFRALANRKKNSNNNDSNRRLSQEV